MIELRLALVCCAIVLCAVRLCCVLCDCVVCCAIGLHLVSVCDLQVWHPITDDDIMADAVVEAHGWAVG